MVDNDGKTKIFGISREITQIKKAEKELHIINEKLDEEVKKRTKELEEANRQLKILSTIDDLTQLPNRRYFEEYFRLGNCVFLLNTVLTVRASEANSHRNQGWEQFTDTVIKTLSAHKEHVVFILWGSPAGAKASLIDGTKHLILKAPHPSPLSSYRGFFGSRPFSKTNDYLKAQGKEPIVWCLN